MVTGTGPATAVVVVDDDPRFLDVLTPVLEADGTFEVVGAVGSAEEVLALLGSVTADLVVVDVHMPGRDGFETTRLLLDAHPELTVVLTSGLAGTGYADLSREVGARGFLPKRALSPEALRALLAETGAATP